MKYGVIHISLEITHQQFIRKMLFHGFWSVLVLTKFYIRFINIVYEKTNNFKKMKSVQFLGQNRETYPFGKIG
jgi:hypothetical protein